MKVKKIALWILRIVPALILLQTLYFKFTAHPQSVHIFQPLGMEPYGRIIIGIMELITALLILYPKTSPWGSILGAGIMCGAILSHLLILGVKVDGDLLLFSLAVIVFLCCSLLFLLLAKEFFTDIKSKWNLYIKKV